MLHYTASRCRLTRCITLQHVARCSTLQHTLQHTAIHCRILQHTATHCNILQHTTTHCNTPQHIATHYNTLQHVQEQEMDSLRRSVAALSQVCETWRIHACDMTHSYVRHDQFRYVIWLIHVCDWFICVTWCSEFALSQVFSSLAVYVLIHTYTMQHIAVGPNQIFLFCWLPDCQISRNCCTYRWVRPLESSLSSSLSPCGIVELRPLELLYLSLSTIIKRSCTEDQMLQDLIFRTRLCGTGFITQHGCVPDFNVTNMISQKCFIPVRYQLPKVESAGPLNMFTWVIWVRWIDRWV